MADLPDNLRRVAAEIRAHALGWGWAGYVEDAAKKIERLERELQSCRELEPLSRELTWPNT